MAGLRTLDDEAARALVMRAAKGDGAAARQLATMMWPHWRRWAAGSSALTGTGVGKDAVDDVVTELVERFGRPSTRELVSFVDWRKRNPEKTLSDWMRIVTANVARDWARAQVGRSRNPSRKRFINEVTSSPAVDEIGVRPTMTAAQTARQVIAWAQRRLDPRSWLGLSIWLAGGSFEEVATKLGIADESEAQKLIRAALAVLRRQFAPDAPSNR